MHLGGKNPDNQFKKKRKRYEPIKQERTAKQEQTEEQDQYRLKHNIINQETEKSVIYI